MSALAVLLALVAASAATPTVGAPRSAVDAGAVALRDTVVAVDRGERVILESPGADVLVDAWDRASVRVEAAAQETLPVEVVRAGGSVRIRIRDWKGHAWDGVLRVSLPSWTPLEVRGREGEVTVQGVTAGVDVRTVDGPVRLSRVGGGVRVRTVEGPVSVDGVSGRVVVRGVDDAVRVSGARDAAIDVETVDGDVFLDDVEADAVDASTVDGDVRFSGPLLPGGVYRLVTHDGDVTVTVAGSADARVRVSTFDGSFDSDFPIVVERFRGGEVLSFTLGEGRAELHMEAFDGEIRLRRGAG